MGSRCWQQIGYKFLVHDFRARSQNHLPTPRIMHWGRCRVRRVEIYPLGSPKTIYMKIRFNSLRLHLMSNYRRGLHLFAELFICKHVYIIYRCQILGGSGFVPNLSTLFYPWFLDHSNLSEMAHSFSHGPHTSGTSICAAVEHQRPLLCKVTVPNLVITGRILKSIRDSHCRYNREI